MSEQADITNKKSDGEQETGNRIRHNLNSQTYQEEKSEANSTVITHTMYYIGHSHSFPAKSGIITEILSVFTVIFTSNELILER